MDAPLPEGEAPVPDAQEQAGAAAPVLATTHAPMRLGTVGWSDTGCCMPFSRLFRPKVPPIFTACQGGDWDTALRLLRSSRSGVLPKWELQHRDGLKRTALHLVVEGDNLAVPLVELMLEKGYDPNLQDVFGDTALHYAVKRRRLSRTLLKVLLEAKGVDINAANGKGRTCLHLAASTPKFPRELVSLIIQKGGDVSKQSNSGRTPLNSAVRRSRKLVPIFLAHGADPFVRTVNGKNAVDWAKENNRLLLQLRLEETRNVVILCTPFSLRRMRAQQQRSSAEVRTESVKTNTGKDRKKSSTASEHDEALALRNRNAPEAPIIMLPIDLIRLVKDMLF